jgi:hypothetical protein
MVNWKFTKVDKFRDLWTKGNFVPGEGYKDWVHIDDKRFDTWKNKDDNFEVGTHRKSNPNTVNGHFTYFKTKPKALSFAKNYMRKY